MLRKSIGVMKEAELSPNLVCLEAVRPEMTNERAASLILYIVRPYPVFSLLFEYLFTVGIHTNNYHI